MTLWLPWSHCLILALSAAPGSLSVGTQEEVVTSQENMTEAFKYSCLESLINGWIWDQCAIILSSSIFLKAFSNLSSSSPSSQLESHISQEKSHGPGKFQTASADAVRKMPLCRDTGAVTLTASSHPRLGSSWRDKQKETGRWARFCQVHGSSTKEKNGIRSSRRQRLHCLWVLAQLFQICFERGEDFNTGNLFWV